MNRTRRSTPRWVFDASGGILVPLLLVLLAVYAVVHLVATEFDRATDEILVLWLLVSLRWHSKRS